jgi:glucose-6-phosphate 1-dehydrogenase
MIIIFGATGDLCKRKIIPALYHLVHTQKLKNFLIIGAAREHTTVDEIFNRSQSFVENYDSASWQEVKNNFIYEAVDVTNLQDMEHLAQRASQLEKERNTTFNRIIYCATASTFFCPITRYSAQTGLAQKLPKNSMLWHRIAYEKPFGNDLQSAQEINQCIAQHFNEHQIYRIDHYLLKEFVSNIALVRFTNIVLEPLWNNRYITNVQIILSETVGIEGRGAYYDAYGAMADVMQNHLLEILTLIAMETPEKLTGEHIRTQRAQALSKVQAIDTLAGQYKGYRSESHVAPQSSTETFAAALLRIQNPRWAGVPFYLKTGKCLAKKETIIHIKFKQVDCLLARNCPSESNSLTITISPESIMSLTLNVKKPGATNDVIPIAMEFSHTKLIGAVTAEAYEILLQDIARGEESISVRFDEIESSWKIIEQLRALKAPLYLYEAGSKGPIEQEEWAYQHGMRWLS